MTLYKEEEFYAYEAGQSEPRVYKYLCAYSVLTVLDEFKAALDKYLEELEK